MRMFSKIGIVVSILILIFSPFILMTSGDYIRLPPPLSKQIDKIAASIGLKLHTISITGFNQTSDEDIFIALDLDDSLTLLNFNGYEASKRLKMLPWVQSVLIKQTFPHRLDIYIKEHQPHALWISQEGDILVSNSGRRLAFVYSEKKHNLPIIEGYGAPEAAHALFQNIKKYPHLLSKISRVVRVADRRWTLVCEGERHVLLPEEDYDHALAAIMQGTVGKRIIDRSHTSFDLRNTGQIVLRPITENLRSTQRDNVSEKVKRTFRG